MDCFYINLDASDTRKNNIEKNFSVMKKSAWTLSRFPAWDTSVVEKLNVAGNLRPEEKACFLSHRQLIKERIGDSKPVFVLEDDAVFGSRTCGLIDRALSDYQNLDWDVLFTDVCIPDLPTMSSLIGLRSQSIGSGKLTLLNLPNMVFAGATAYIVNGKSKVKLFRLLESETALNVPYDLFLRKLIHERKINGYALFPFVTSLSDDSDSSQIQEVNSSATDVIWNTYRRLVWMDRDLDAMKRTIDMIDHHLCDDESRLFGTLFAAMTSSKFKPK